MNTDTFTQSDFFFSTEIENLIKKDKEIYQFDLEVCNDSIPLFKFVQETLNDNENLLLTVALQERKQEFLVNAYWYLLHLRSNYEDENVNIYQATELAMEDIKEIFKSYNQKDIRPLFD